MNIHGIDLDIIKETDIRISIKHHKQQYQMVLVIVFALVFVNVILLCADNFGVEYLRSTQPWSFAVHPHWIIYNGGFLHENMKLVEWAIDPRNGDLPYIGASYYIPPPIKDNVGGLVIPIVIV